MGLRKRGYEIDRKSEDGETTSGSLPSLSWRDELSAGDDRPQTGVEG
jgi:hypothetical protein